MICYLYLFDYKKKDHELLTVIIAAQVKFYRVYGFI